MLKSSQVSVDPDLKLATILRRYIDLPKYLDLLRSNAIYLRRADRFPDKLEGILPVGMRSAMNEAYLSGQSTYDADSFSQKAREGIYVNCWSLGARDNMALWQLYGSASMGIVVTTTIGRLIDVGLEWARSESVEIFKVRYIDHFKNPDMIIGTYSDPLRFKNEAYSFEHEVRIIVSRLKQISAQSLKPEGIRLPIELKKLIRSVVVSPEAGSWFFDLVSDVTTRYGVIAPVRRSKLSYLPK